MKMDVIEKKDNPFLKRTDLMLMVDHKGQATPKREDLEKDIAKQFKSVPEKVEIVYIFSGVGLTKSKVKARVWKEKVVEKKVRKSKEEVKEKKEKTKPEEEPMEEKKETSKEKSKKEQPKSQKKEGEKK